jgi:hypothetical protein
MGSKLADLGGHGPHARARRAKRALALGQRDPEGSRPGKLLSPQRRRRAVDCVRARLDVSERRAFQALGQFRSTHRRVLRADEFEDRLVSAIMDLACRFGRYGYRRIEKPWAKPESITLYSWHTDGIDVHNWK